MPFSRMTRWLRTGQPVRSETATHLRMDALEDRRTPAASLFSANSSFTASANGDAQLVAVANDGIFAIFTSTATDIIPGQIDTPGTPDLFWVNTLNGQRQLVTAKAGSFGLEATGNVGRAVISGDGQTVAFVSSVGASVYDTNFTPAADAGNVTNDVFAWNAQTGLITLVSRQSNTAAFGQSTDAGNPAISADGQNIAFTSTLTIGGAGSGSDVANTLDVFRYTLGATSPVVVSLANPGQAYGFTGDVIVDSLGRYMDSSGTTFAIISNVSADVVDPTLLPTPAQLTTATNVWLVTVAGGTNPNPVSQLVSSSASNSLKSVGSTGGKVSAAILAYNSPQAVIFASTAKSGAGNELVNGYTNNNGGQPDLYYRLMSPLGGQPTVLITAINGSTNLGANDKLDPAAGSFVVSADGSRVAFTSLAKNLTPTVTDTNNSYDVFTWDYSTKTNSVASRLTATATTGNNQSFGPSLSGDGRYVAFETSATNLFSATEANTGNDVVVRDLSTNTSSLVSSIPNGSSTGNGSSFGPQIVGSGASPRVLFNSFATTLDPLFPGMTFGQIRVFGSTLPIQNNNAPRQAVVSGTRDASASFVTFDGSGNTVVGNKFTPFPGFNGEVTVAQGDFNGDGINDLVAGAGPNGGPRVTIIDGANGKKLRDFFAFEATFTGGVNVAAADLNGDSVADLVVGAGNGGASRVRVFNAGNPASVITDFFVYELSFRGGVRVATGDVNGDGRADLITGAGFGGGPRVTVISGKTVGTTNTRLADFFAFESSQRDGVYVSAGDIDNDGKADLAIGAGPNGGPRVQVFGGASVITGTPQPTSLLNFFAFNPNLRNGVRVAVKNIDGDATGDLIVSQGPSGLAQIRTFSGGKLSSPGVPNLIDDFYLYGDVGSVLGAWVG